MKKIIATLAILLGTAGMSFADGPLNVSLGLTGALGLFDATGSEKMTGTHIYKRNNSDGDENTVNDSKTTTTTRDDMAIGYGAIVAELSSSAIPALKIGLEYVPYDLKSDTTENKRNDKIAGTDQGSESANTDTGTSKVGIDIENMMTAYVALHAPTDFGNVFVRAGIITADVITDESLVTGSKYGNTSLDGTLIGIGVEKSLQDGVFVRGEVNQTSYDNMTLTNTGSTNNNTITVKDLSGNSVQVSVGKTF